MNLNQRDNALSVREYLGGMFGSDIIFTQFVKTKPVEGGDGYYINALAEIHTNMPYGCVPIDIDILQYGDERFKEDDWKRDYVKALWKELRQKRR